MKNKKIIIGMVVILLVAVALPSFNYLKTRVLWKNVFDLKYEGANSSKAFVGGDYTLTNKTSNTYQLEYIYVHAEPIVGSEKTVKIKIYQTVYPNSSVEIRILEDDLLELFGLDSVPIWGDISIKGFEYKKK